jgi:glycosyltransferase involved in cell wall biosynthesis
MGNSITKKKKLIISGINLFEGGALSIIIDCLSYLNDSELIENFSIIALVHKKNLFDKSKYNNISFIEFSKSRKSYLYRLYYEYYYFKKFAKKNNVNFWLSLHDITPSLGKNIPQAVYCHNPSPFHKVEKKDFFVEPIFFFFTLFYRFLYQINIKKNKFVIVQQHWIRNEFIKMFNLKQDNIIVSPPKVPRFLLSEGNNDINTLDKECKTFFYPTLARSFKNIEIICEAIKFLDEKDQNNLQIFITIDGTENSYSKRIYDKYKSLLAIKFIGRISREDVYAYYNVVDCLIFPSKLETWGLPITEFKQFNKPIFISDLPYAKETINGYEKINYFHPDDSVKLAELISNLLNENLTFSVSKEIEPTKPIANNWKELFDLLIYKEKS